MKINYHKCRLLLILLLSVITVKITAKVINNPPFEGRNTCILSITKIERTSKYTKLHFHAQYIPHSWIKLRDSVFIEDVATGKSYYPIRFEGFEANKEIYLPESGQMDFSIVYPKIPKNVKKINWKENKSIWQIWGISLDGKKAVYTYQLPKAVTDQKKDNGADFTKDNFFKTDSAYITGYLKGYDTRLGITCGIIYSINELTHSEYPTVVKINPDGSFKTKLLLYYPIENCIYLKKYSIPFYLEPGQHLDIQVNMDDLLYTEYRLSHSLDITYTSPTADICEQVKEDYMDLLTNKTEYAKSLNSFIGLELEKKCTSSQVIEKFMPLYERRKTDVDSIIKSDHYSPKAAHLKRNREAIGFGCRLLDFASDQLYNASRDTTNARMKDPVKKTFYDFMKEMPIDDEVALACYDYGMFVNRFEFNNNLYNINIDTNSTLYNITPSYTLYDKLRGSFIWQLSTLRGICSYKSFIDSGAMTVKPNVFKNPTIKAYANNILSKKMDEKKPYELPDNQAARMFKKLITPYKGKYIFIDFWGTTCGPCRAGIKSMAPLRERLQNNANFQFLYITGESSSPSKQDYNEYVKKNLASAPSIYLNDADYLYLRELFHFNGIPRYVLVSRDGKIIDEDYSEFQLRTFLKDKGFIKNIDDLNSK